MVQKWEFRAAVDKLATAAKGRISTSLIGGVVETSPVRIYLVFDYSTRSVLEAVDSFAAADTASLPEQWRDHLDVKSGILPAPFRHWLSLQCAQLTSELHRAGFRHPRVSGDDFVMGESWKVSLSCNLLLSGVFLSCTYLIGIVDRPLPASEQEDAECLAALRFRLLGLKQRADLEVKQASPGGDTAPAAKAQQGAPAVNLSSLIDGWQPEEAPAPVRPLSCCSRFPYCCYRRWSRPLSTICEFESVLSYRGRN